MSTPVEDLKAVFAREKEKFVKDNPILVPESFYDTAVRIVKDNNILVKIEPVKAVWKNGRVMKPGDKVWVWNAWGEKKHQIEQGILVSFTPGCVDAWVQMPQFRERPYHFLLDEVFPTREALCEHYRKIFE